MHQGALVKNARKTPVVSVLGQSAAMGSSHRTQGQCSPASSMILEIAGGVVQVVAGRGASFIRKLQVGNPARWNAGLIRDEADR